MNDIPPYKVYGLIDPRNNRVFYIGMSYILLSRVPAHNTDKNGAAYVRCQEIIQDGYRAKFCVFGIFEDGEEAARLESYLITALPVLVNRTHKQERREFWRSVANIVDDNGDIDAIDVLMNAQCE